MDKSSPKKKWKSPLTKGVINTRFYLFTAVIIVLITAPFWHKFFPKSSTEQFMGFKNTRVFLYSFGSHLSSFAISLFLLISSQFIIPAFKKLIQIVALLFIGISFYFTFWTLAPITDYPRWVYEMTIVFLSILAVVIVSLLVNINKKLKADYIKHHKENNEFIRLANNFIDDYKLKYDNTRNEK